MMDNTGTVLYNNVPSVGVCKFSCLAVMTVAPSAASPLNTFFLFLGDTSCMHVSYMYKNGNSMMG